MRLNKVYACVLIFAICAGFFTNVYAAGEISALSEIFVSNADKMVGATIQTDGAAGDIYADAYLRVPNVDFGNRMYKEVIVNYAVEGAYAGGKIMICTDSVSSAPIAEAVLPSTGSWYDYKSINIELDNPYISGVHDLYIKFLKRSMCSFKSIKFVSMETGASLPSDIIGTDIEQTVQKLASIGIFDLSERSFKPDSAVTNAELFEIAQKFRPYGLNPQEYAEKNNVDLEARTSIEEILKVFAYIAGYGEIEGIPMIQNDLGIFDGVSIKNGKITKANLVKCIDNFLDVEVYKLSDKKYEKSDSTILNECFHMYEAVGIVKSNEYTALVGSPKNNSVIIGDTEYSIDNIDIYQYFGQNVKYLYKDEDGELSVCYAHPYRNTVLELTDKNTESCKGLTLRYTDDSTGRSKAVHLNNDFVFVYNNKVISEFDEGVFSGFNGTLKLIDNNRDSKHDVVIMTDTYDVVVSSCAGENIYGKNNFSMSLSGKNYILRKVTGEITDESYLSRLREKTILSIAEVMGVDGEELLDISVSNMSVSGVLKSYSYDDYGITTLMINGEEYKLSKKSEGFSGNLVGAFVNVYLNVNREAVFIESSVQIEMVGYMEKYTVDEEDNIYIKIFGEDEVMHNFTCAEKVKIDGKSYKKTNDIKNVLNARFKQGLVRLSVNEAGKITMIDFPYNFIKFGKAEGLFENEDPNSLYISFDGSSNYKWYGHSFWGNSTLSGDSRVFLIPTDGDEDKYAVKVSENYFSNDTPYTIKAYGYDKNQISTPFYLVMYDGTSPISDTGKFAVVTDVKIDSTYDMEKEEITSSVEYFQNGVKEIKNAVPNIKSELEKLNAGDLFKFNVDLNGNISVIQKIFDINLKKESNGTSGFDTPKRYMTVKIKKLNGTYAVIDGTSEITNLSCGAGVYVYDSSKSKKERIQKADIDDIVTLEMSSNADTVFISQYHGETNGVYIIR